MHVTDATSTAETAGGWRVLLGPRYLGTSTLLAGGVALYAINEFLTISLLPSTVADIGGERLFAWVTTLYLVGSVVAAATVNAALLRLGARASYLLGLAVFGIGSVVCAAAPNMEVLLAGRTLQGAAGGLLAGLGYALISAVLPQALWTRASALVSAMWGVATIVGPATGGLFAQFGLWRWAFGAVAILTAAMAALVPMVLPAGRADPDCAAPALKIPVWSLLLLGTAALTVSVAEVPHNTVAATGLLAASVLLVAVFVVVDRRVSLAVLPPSAFRFGSTEVDLSDGGAANGRGDGRHVCAVVRATPGASESVGGRLFGRGTGGRLDCQRDRQCITEQQARHCRRGRCGTADHGRGPGVGRGYPGRSRVGGPCGAVGTGADDQRDGHRGVLAAPVGVGDAIGRRRERSWNRCRGDQHGAADLRSVRRWTGRRRGQQRRGRCGHGRPLAVRGVRRRGRSGRVGRIPRHPGTALTSDESHCRPGVFVWIAASVHRLASFVSGPI